MRVAMQDIDIAQSVEPYNITEIAAACGILEEELELYGRDKAKVCVGGWEQGARSGLLSASAASYEAMRKLDAISQAL